MAIPKLYSVRHSAWHGSLLSRKQVLVCLAPNGQARLATLHHHEGGSGYAIVVARHGKAIGPGREERENVPGTGIGQRSITDQMSPIRIASRTVTVRSGRSGVAAPPRSAQRTSSGPAHDRRGCMGIVEGGPDVVAMPRPRRHRCVCPEFLLKRQFDMRVSPASPAIQRPAQSHRQAWEAFPASTPAPCHHGVDEFGECRRPVLWQIADSIPLPQFSSRTSRPKALAMRAAKPKTTRSAPGAKCSPQAATDWKCSPANPHGTGPEASI